MYTKLTIENHTQSFLDSSLFTIICPVIGSIQIVSIALGSNSVFLHTTDDITSKLQSSKEKQDTLIGIHNSNIL